MTAREALRGHWPEYLMEAAALGMFMFSACVFVTLIEHPASVIPHLVDDPLLRRALIGLAMGLTAILIIYSPWGQQSGAHFNPAVTLTFYRLGKVEPWDAVFYVVAQFLGGITGVVSASLLLGQSWVTHPNVNYVATLPGHYGTAAAFAAEVAISFGLMLVVLMTSNIRTLNRYTGAFAGLLVATYITVEAPISGMSMNPARTLGSAVLAQTWTALWVYFTAPILGMLFAAEIYLRFKGTSSILCCKLHHENSRRCIFSCRYAMASSSEGAPTANRAVPAIQPEHEAWIPAAMGSLAEAFRIAERSVGPIVDVVIRLRLAQIFFVSGVLKASNWDNAIYLSSYEYPVSWMDPATAAYVGVTIELLGAVLLAAVWRRASPRRRCWRFRS